MKYNFLKKIVIIPVMVASLTGCLVYGNYENGTVVAYANPAYGALDWFVQALGSLGFSFASIDSANDARKSFGKYLQDEVDFFVNETAPALIDVVVNNQDLNISASKADLAMWNSVFNKGQTINEAKFNSLQYKDLQMVTENSVASGSYSALTVFTRGWLTKLAKDGHLPDFINSAVGNTIHTVEKRSWDSFGFMSILRDQIFLSKVAEKKSLAQWNYILDSFETDVNNDEIYNRVKSCGSKYWVGMESDAQWSGVCISICDIEDDVISIEIGNYENGNHFKIIKESGVQYRDDLFTKRQRFTGNGKGYVPSYRGTSAYNYRFLKNDYIWSSYESTLANCWFLLPMGFSANIDSDDYLPVTWNIDNYAPSNSGVSIDDIGSGETGTAIDNPNFDMTKIKNIDLTVSNSIPLNIADTQVVPKTATDIIDKVAADDIADAVTDIDTAIDDSKTDTISDVVPVPEAGDYAINLTRFFPFCIPFDIYNLLQCINASPQAPVIHWEFNNFGKTESIDIDLSSFNSIASIMRILETIAFCVGLGLVTNKLIKH